MPWNKHDYPPSMKNLEPRVREKAVDIANALLRDGYEEGRSLRLPLPKPRNGTIIIQPSKMRNLKNMKNSIQAKMYTTIIPLLPIRMDASILL
ncbi:hypothetical protein ACTP13_16770 [Paenibacillus peoriae]|uniref:hypothetical protein n=1 Tax=Paenibacillus peoriae TaxID=59893 RepID=UPI003F98A324